MKEKKWNDDFQNRRVIMNEKKNVTIASPINTDQQLSLLSEYYAECYAKGGVSVQLGGWIFTLHCFMGGIDDIKYIIQSKLLKQQELFQQQETSCYVIRFYVMLCYVNLKIIEIIMLDYSTLSDIQSQKIDINVESTLETLIIHLWTLNRPLFQKLKCKRDLIGNLGSYNCVQRKFGQGIV